MLQTIRKVIAVPVVPLQPVATVASVAAFGWLLANDLIQPFLVFLLQLYLAF